MTRPQTPAENCAVGEAWLARFRVTLMTTDHKKLSGGARVSARTIRAPWPASTPARLYVLAHEIGHVLLRHDQFCPLPLYAQEFEAELGAHCLMRTEGLTVPASMTESAKRYVRKHINRALRDRSVDEIDPAIMNWADPLFYRAMKHTRPGLFRPDGPRYFAAAKKRVHHLLIREGVPA